MTQPQKNTALTFAILAGLVSLPLTWMSIGGATFPDVVGMFGGMSFDVTGLNGNITLLFQKPLWLIIGVAITANVLQFMHNSKTFAIPRFAEWLTAILAVVWIAHVILATLFSDQATLGIGALLGFACAVIPLLCLVTQTSQEQVPNADSNDVDA